MTRVLVTAPLPAGGTDPLEVAGFEVVELAGDVHAALLNDASQADAVICVLTDWIDRSVLEAGGDRLQVVATVAAGHDNIDVEAATELGIAVCNTPGILDETTAELAFALALMARRRTSEAEAALRSGGWTGWQIDGFLGHDLLGSTLGIVGWGQIGQALGRRGSAFGMEVIHTSRRPTGHPGYVDDLDELLRRADVVSLHVPLTSATRHLIDHGRLGAMKPTAVLVNTSRGKVVDEGALADALHDGVIFGAGLDVFEDEPTVDPGLLSAPGAVLLPHIGSATVATRTNMARAASQAVIDVLAGRPTTALLNGPSGH